jgi:hypothetical protein
MVGWVLLTPNTYVLHASGKKTVKVIHINLCMCDKTVGRLIWETK